MKHIVIAPFPPPLGGVAVAATNLTVMLAGRNQDVTRFNTSGGAAREDLYKPKGPLAYLRNLGLFFRFRRDVIAGGDGNAVHHLFVNSGPSFLRDAVLLGMLRMAGRRVFVHLHSKTQGEFFLSGWRLRLFGKVLGRASLVFVLSEGHRRFFARYVPEARLRVLENFVVAGEFVPGSGTRAADMLYLSRLSEMKGTWDLLHAVDRLFSAGRSAGLRVTIAGTADTEETQRALEEFVAGHGLADTVTFVGSLRGEAKTEAFRTHGVFLFPSRFENSPVTLKEACQAEMAVLASDLEANRAVIERCGNSLLYPVGDPAGLAAAMERVLGDEELFGRLRRDARNAPKYDEEYAWRVLVDILEV